MKKINKFLLLFFIEILSIFFILFIIPSIFLNKINEQNESGSLFFVPLENNKEYTTNLPLSYPNLEQIYLMLKNTNLSSKEAVTVIVNDNPFQINGGSIGDPSWVPIKFNPIKDSLTIKIFSPTKATNSLFFGINKSDNSFAIKKIYQILGFKNKFLYNFAYQINKLKNNGKFLTIYFLMFLGLNYLYVKKK